MFYKHARMQYLLAAVLLVVTNVVDSLSYDPADYLEVYPDPTDPEVLQERTPLYFALIQSLGGENSQFDASGSLAGVKVALDWINNDSSLLPGYTLHYTVANSQVRVNRWQQLALSFIIDASSFASLPATHWHVQWNPQMLTLWDLLIREVSGVKITLFWDETKCPN